ncbi:MAG: hypothetical protein EPO07_02475 [Verrucomicrobia bacterium]|nr:MAG: hypothetical protein EPO07_02475 [Verrucomicrobiota bacterium]
MKKLILAAMIVALSVAGLQTAKAGDREWAVVGKVLTGVAAAAVVANAIDARADYSVSYGYSAPAYCAPRTTVVYAPAPVTRVVYVQSPVVVYRAPAYCAPRAYVSVGYGYRHGHHYGRSYERCR